MSRAARVAAATALMACATGLVPVATAGQAQAATCASGADVAVTVTSTSVALGDTVTFTGNGWCHPTGGGSRIGVKLDAGAYSRPDTAVHTNKSLWAVVEADPDGTFRASLDLPDGTRATSTPALPTGTHTLQLLTGSLKSGDAVRSVVSNSFKVTDPAAGCSPTSTTPKVSLGNPTVEVGGVLRFSGTGWCHPTEGGSRIAVKIDGGGVVRNDTTVHANKSIWALVDADPADGTFSAELRLPDGTTAGSTPALTESGHTLQLLTGSLKAGDTVRTLISPTFTVVPVGTSIEDPGGEDPDGEDPDDDSTTCVPTTKRPTVRIADTSVGFGDTLVLTGTGWCHPTGGGSVVAVKLDEGAYSRLDGSIDPNRTVFAVIRARASTGSFRAELRLPDGTGATSTPALTSGVHNLRLLSGSMRAGDRVRTVQSEPFVVGAYRPNGPPDPLDAATLTASNTAGMTVTRHGASMTVQLPAARPGDWVFLSAYAEDGSPRYPWGDRWLRVPTPTTARATAALTVSVPHDGTLAGRMRLVAQSGEFGRTGQLLGWTALTFSSAAATSGGPTSGSPVPAMVPAAVPALAPPVALVAPSAVRLAGLTATTRGGVTAAREADVVTLTVPGATVATPVYVYAVTTGRSLPGGWITVAADRTVRIDLGKLDPAAWYLTVQGVDGRLLGWAVADLREPVDELAGTGADPDPQPGWGSAPARAAEDDRALVRAADGILLGVGGSTLVLAVLVVRRRRTRGVA